MTARSRTVLVVDDSIGVQTAVREALRPLSSTRVVCFGDVDGAEAWLDSALPDVALCDVVLPDRSGYDLCRLVKSRRAACAVLLLSSPFETFEEGQSASCGADGVIGKPFTAEELRSRVESLLAAIDAGSLQTRDAAPEAPAAIETNSTMVGEHLTELSEDDVVRPEPRTASEPQAEAPPEELLEPLVERLLEPLVERLLPPLQRRLLQAGERGTLHPALERVLGEAADRLVRQRLRELEDEAIEAPYGPEEAD